ncbi:MAG: L-2-hydroxyglutarate oxidase [Bacteroidota bacterium]
MTISSDILITGAGAVGLATALQIQQRRPNWSVIVVDKADRVAAHQTGHNSGVIHSGVYYPPGGTRARLCHEGYNLLLEFCAQENVPYRLTGKFIVAVAEREITGLREIERRGKANGLTDLRWMTGAEMREHSPHTGGIAALWVPQSGIVDYAEVSRAYSRKIIRQGGEVRLNTEVLGYQRDGREFVVTTNRGDLRTKRIVNCGGLQSDLLSSMSGARPQVQILPFRGEYYELKAAAAAKVQHLIYPVPDPAFPFLGVHLTPMIDGRVEAGPNAVLAFAREGYNNRTVNWRELAATLRYSGFRALARQHWRKGALELRRSFSKQTFLESLLPLMPSLTLADLQPGGAGVRAMAVKPDGSMVDDFLFYGSRGLVNVTNAPSPAATASLAIGKYVSELVLKE